MSRPCQLSLFYRESHDFSASLTVSWPHKLISQVRSPLCGVNTYKCHSNGVSDADFVSQGTKNAAWCWERSPNFASCGRGLYVQPCVYMQVVQATQASIEAVSDSELSIFLQWGVA